MLSRIRSVSPTLSATSLREVHLGLQHPLSWGAGGQTEAKGEQEDPGEDGGWGGTVSMEE